jgi:hypothetical protein
MQANEVQENARVVAVVGPCFGYTRGRKIVCNQGKRLPGLGQLQPTNNRLVGERTRLVFVLIPDVDYVVQIVLEIRLRTIQSTWRTHWALLLAAPLGYPQRFPQNLASRVAPPFLHH